MRIRLAAMAMAISALATTPADARDTDELVIGMTQFPSTFHPSIDAMMAKSYVLAMTRRPFTTYDPDWKLICMLCTELPSIENGLAVPEKTPDGKQGIAVTYTIQPEATWGDGVPVTTRDVQFTWEVGRHPRSGIENMELYRTIQKIDVRDDKTFTMHFDKLTFDYAGINDFLLLPAHIEETPFHADPENYRNRTAFDTDTTNDGLYFGPYVVAEVVPGSHIVLEPNPGWWGKTPEFKRIIVRVIENTAAMEANLLSGAIDMVAGELGLSLDQAIAFEKRHGRQFQVIYKPGLIYEHVDMRLDNPILADIRVRKALVHAIDRESINRQLFDGKQPVALSFVNPLDWVHSTDIPTYAYDPKAAIRLLNDAGWRKTLGGVRHDDAGNPLTLDIITTAGNRSRELIEQALQSQWKSVGIDVRIRNQPARVMFSESLSQRKFQGLAMYAWISSPENVPRTTQHSAFVPGENNNFAGQNYPGYAIPEVDDLLERIEVELDREKRRGMWQRLQHLYAENLPVIPLYFRSDAFVLPLWLRGVEPTGHQYPTSLWVENWHAEP